MKIRDFVKKNIDIPSETWKRARSRVESIKELLKSNVDEISEFQYQGSYSRKTVVRPKTNDDEFDIDITANIRSIKNNDLLNMREFAHNINVKLVEQYGERASSFGDKPSKATNVKFNKEFHIDVVPLLINDGEFVYDTIKNEISISNPLMLSSGFNENVKRHPDNSLRDTVKLIKYMRNLRGIKEIPSIIIDIFYSQVKPHSNNYEENVILLLRKFSEIRESTTNPYCLDEVINVDPWSLSELKKEIEELANKLSKNDFTGLKNAFKKLGATFVPAVAIASSVSAKLGTGAAHISAQSNDK